MAEEEAKLSADSIKNDMELLGDKGGENEEFYEDIEAPKFVDFTVADHYRPDDRYWFCLRVGCDQKHEEEMDSEAIYKNFVLRVMAARSPNVRLHKALNRNCSSKNTKCPLSAPPKSYKSRLSRLAIISSISQKIGDDKDKVKPLPKVTSTPKPKGKQVAAKYLTTPRNKKCIPNPNAYQSVQNPKLPSVAVPKSRMVAKTLIFQSPNKGISLKSSVELRTPLTKLCEGMKKLEIASQRKPVLGCSSKQSKQLRHQSQKSSPLHSSRRQKGSNQENCTPKISQQVHTKTDQDGKSLRSLKGKSKGKLSIHSNLNETSRARKVKAKSRDENKENAAVYSSTDPAKEADCQKENVTPSTELESSDASTAELSNSPNSEQTNMRGDDLPILHASNEEDNAIQEKVNANCGITEVSHGNRESLKNVVFEDETSQGAGCENEIIQSDDKENASTFDENSFKCKKDHSGRKILGAQNSDRKKVTEAVDKDLKGHATISAPGMKLMKLKPTNPKPFRLRTDERGILREANLERKNHAVTPQKEASAFSRFQGRDFQEQLVDIQKGTGSLKPTEQQLRTKISGLRALHLKQQRLKPTKPTVESTTSRESDYDLKKTKTSSRNNLQPQRHLYNTAAASSPDKPISVVIGETASENSKSKEVGKPSNKVTTTVVRPRAPSGSRSISRGRRIVTIPKEPNSHRSHTPKRLLRELHLVDDCHHCPS